MTATALLLALTAAPAAAETYKWVDAKGVVNYSGTPPPTVAARPRVIEERVSVIPPDPSVGAAATALEARLERRAQYEEADFARRQQFMLEAQMAQMNYAAPADAYAAPAYYYPYGYGDWRGRAGGAGRFAPRVDHYRAPVRPGGFSVRTGGRAPAGRGPMR